MRISTWIVAVVWFASCSEEKAPIRNYPIVFTREIGSISNGLATFNGEILTVSSGILDHGFVWTRVGFPNLTNDMAERKSLGAKDKPGTFTFTTPSNLLPGKTYDMCAYVRSGQYIVYGKTFVFVSK